MSRSMFRQIALACVGVGSLALATPASATIVNFNDFSDTSSLTLSGNAAVVTSSDGKVLRVTPALAGQSGSAFSTATINAATFSTFFKFRITNPGGSLFDSNNETGADGLVFVVQSVSSSIGGFGEGIGYKGILKSVGAEWDTWHNPYNHDPDPYPTQPISNHIGIDVNGVVDHGVGSPNTKVIPTRFDDGNIWYGWVDYNGTTLEVRTNQTGVRSVTADLSRDLDLVSILGQTTAYVGFTSGTGADWGNHDILSWEYRDTFDPIIPDRSIPEPASASMLGLAGLLMLGRRTRRA